MKRNRWFLAIVVLTACLVTAALFFMPLTPSALSAVSVTEQAQNTTEIHNLHQDAARQLVAALQGPAEHERPENINAVYDMTLHLNILFPRHYQVYVTSAREIYLKRSIGHGFIRAKNAQFFYTHEAFQSLYAFAQMPDVRIVTQDEDVCHHVEKRRWQFLRWDDHWQEAKLPPLSESSGEWAALYSPQDYLFFMVDPMPDNASLQVTDPTGITVFDGTLAAGRLPVFQYNGLYEYRLSLSWQDEDQPYRGQYDASFLVYIELPPIFEMPDKIVQGELAVFYARHIPQGMRPVFELEIDRRMQFFPHEDGYVTYLPTHYGTAPGEYRLAYGLEGQPLKESTLVVLPRNFHIQHLRVDAGIVASTRNEAAYEQFSRYFPKARETSADIRYYDQSFILPVSGRLTTEFGQTRFVNNAPTSYRHSGLDIAAPTGTPVLATNDGRVTLSMELTLTGNTVVLDHGQGLFSVYYHMHALLVEEGQRVERGETIGTVGSTGFSTGPHLHFTMSYYAHNLEPGYFLVGEPVTFENANVHLQE